MANANIVSGLIPRRLRNGSPFCGPLRKYYVAAGDSTALYIGDPVILSGTADDNGVPAVTRAGSTGRITGVVCGIANDDSLPSSNDMMETGYRAASTAGYVLVCDDPEVLYEVQEDSDTSTLAATDVGLNANLIVAAGDADTRQSGTMLDSSSAATTAGLQVRIVELAHRPDNEIGDNAKWLVALNQTTETGAAGSTGV